MNDSKHEPAERPADPENAPGNEKPKAEARPKFAQPVGPRLRKLMVVVLVLFSLLAVNSAYMSAVTFADWLSPAEATLKNYVYIANFLGHLVLGILITVPVLAFGILHIRNAWHWPNRRAVKAGMGLFATSIVLLLTGYLLTRVDGFPIEIKDGTTRETIYWIHVISPIVACWLFVLHRLAGKRIKWKVGLVIGAVAAAFAFVMVLFHSQDPTKFGVVGPKDGAKYFFPSLARTATGNFIPADSLIMDDYCRKCHEDIHNDWSHSVHKFSSFNNPAYLFSVQATRKKLMERDGEVRASRFCAGCHDPVPFFSGAFEHPRFDDPNYDLASDPQAQAGITCTVCHSITAVNSVKGNSDYTIEEPVHYPFAKSDNSFLQWVNNQLVKAKPELHKKTFLKPFHKTEEFCGTCHKVHLPQELNDYKWLRGQNHYDAYLLSGVSGHGVTSFYYPPKAKPNCSEGCHMPLIESDDFGAKDFDGSGVAKIHDHMFPSANTAIPHMLGFPEWVNEKHREFNEGVMRLDIFGLIPGGEIGGELLAPLRPQIPTLEPGGDYLLETVVRTVKMGHLFTQGTADSNEVWVELEVKAGDRVIGRTGGRDEQGRVDPWSHFINAYVLDRDGNRIDRRNAEDIFVALYNNQIPPGAADVVHSRFRVPDDVSEPITVTARLHYRKFDTTYLEYIRGKGTVNDLPVMLLAEDTMTFPIAGGPAMAVEPSKVPEWQRWNDYGIGLFRKGSKGSSKGELRQAEAAFARVEALDRPDGPLNRARVYFKEGRLDDAVAALRLAKERGAPLWTITWFTGLVNKQNGNLDAAIENFTTILENRFDGLNQRGFDFSLDYRVINELGKAYFDRSKQERRDPERRDALLNAAVAQFQRTLELDPENVTAHYNLYLVFKKLAQAEGAPAKLDEDAQHHFHEWEKYRLDDNARDSTVQKHRAANPAANHAAEAVVIYDLQRDGAYGLERASDSAAEGE